MSVAGKWLLVLAVLVVAGVVLVSWLSSISHCKLVETVPVYSPNGRFYTQVHGIFCRDDAKTQYSLLLGEPGKQGREVLLEFNSSPSTIHYSWHGDELDIQAPRTSIVKEHGPFDANPRVVVTSP
jgi:hypothetical protein